MIVPLALPRSPTPPPKPRYYLDFDAQLAIRSSLTIAPQAQRHHGQEAQSLGANG